MANTQINIGDKFRDPNLTGSPCVVTAVDPASQWFEARWMPGAPAYRYPARKASKWIKAN